ncbi:hypothetical protein ACE2AK_23605 [Rahnella perminowiae]|uniref:hypothetical protein n=1 Tax=Rahnella perminowiae TaxID=2816244 RepID=UPI003652EE19
MRLSFPDLGSDVTSMLSLMVLIKDMLCIYFSADHSLTNHGIGHVRLEQSADVRNQVAMDLANNAVCQSTGIMSIPVAHHGLVMPFSGTHTV